MEKTLSEIIAEHSLPPFVFALIIGVPSMFLYVFEVVIVIVHSKEFNSAFFYLFLVRALLNLLNYFSTYMYNRFGRVGLFKDLFLSFSPTHIAFWFFFNFYNYHCENLMTCFILVNRLTSILFPNKQKKIWKYLLPISILTTLVLPLPFVVHNFTWRYLAYIWTDFRTGNRTFAIAYHYDAGWELDWLTFSDSWFAAVTAIGFLIMCGLLNIATIVVYKWSKRKYEAMRKETGVSKSANVMEEERIERRLHIYAFVTFLGQLLMCIFLIIIYKCSRVFDPNDPRSTLFLATFNQLGWVNDISSIVIPSWLILWASTLLRQMVMDSVCRTVRLPFKYMWNKIAGIEGMSVTHITTTSLVRRVA